MTSKPKIKLGIAKTERPAPTDEFHSLSKLNEYIKEIVENNVFFMFTELLKKISQDHMDKGLNFEELKEQYLSYFQKNLKNSNLYCDVLSLNLQSVDFSKTPPKEEVHSESDEDKDKEKVDDSINPEKCYARTATNTQCSRKKQKDGDFCGSHTHSQPYGRVDQPCAVETQPKKRGRPAQSCKKAASPPPTAVPAPIPAPAPTQNQIEATIETIGDIDYVVDNNTNNIYKMLGEELIDGSDIDMDNLKLVGKKTSSNKVMWYTDTDLMFVK
jgi:hypothetical protein